MQKKAILLINGEIDLQFCEQYIDKCLSNLPIYCVDGAFNQIKDTKIAVNVRMIIGDGDSTHSAQFPDVPYQQYDDQYSTDFDKSLRTLYKMGYRLLFLFGFGGKEMDHYLGNLSTLCKYQNQFQFMVIDSYGVSQLIYQKMRLGDVKGKMVSIVPLFELVDLTLHGFAFNLDEWTLKFGKDLGIRNYAFKDEVFIDYKTGNGLVFLSHKPYHRFSVE